MVDKSIKKILLICLCLISFSLVGCFHVPDKDWLPNRNKVNTWDIKNNEEMEDAINSLMNGVNIISSEWNVLNEYDEINDEETEQIPLETKTDTIDDEIFSDTGTIDSEI